MTEASSHEPATLTFVGTGSAFDAHLPNTSLLYTSTSTLLLDCGYAVPHALWRLTRDPHALDAVWISHVHADHSFGLPGLLAWMKAKGRTRPLDILGGPGVGPWLERLLDLGYPGSFGASCNFDVRPLPLRPGPTTQWRDLTLSVAASEHKVRNLALRIEDGTRSVCYSGDGAPTEATRALFHGTDLLIHECYGAQHARPGHACLSELLILAAETKVSRLALVHLAEEQAPQIHAMVANYKGPTSLSLPSPGDKLTW